MLPRGATQAPLADQRGWTDPVDYTRCLALADQAHEAHIQAIRYTSVRDRQGRANVALLTCRTFTRNDTVERRT